MKKFLTVLVASLVLLIPSISYSQEQKCDGPPALCAQIKELQQDLNKQKSLSASNSLKISQEDQEKEAKHKALVMKLTAGAASMAVALKILLSLLANWKDYFQGDKGKAWLRIITLSVGLLAFLASNIGFGIPWYSAIILAGGGPGAIVIHEIMKIIPVLKGKEKYSDATNADPTDNPIKTPSKPPVA
jgi:hypothetical protein